MFRTVERLIMTLAPMAGGHNSEEHKEWLLAVLHTIEDKPLEPRQRVLIDAAIQFIESSAWTLLWTRIKWDNAYPGGCLSGTQLIDLDQLLVEHFRPIEEGLLTQM